MQMIQIQQCMFSNYSKIKLEINNEKIPGKLQIFADSTFLNNLQIKEEIKTESIKYFELMENEKKNI